MTQAEKTNLTRLKNNQKFIEVIKKLTCGNELTDEEKSYILTIAMFFLRHYENDKRFRTYIEFAYYIILKYSISYQDFKPLYDFSTEFGFFPISKSILENKLIENLTLKDILIDSEIESFSYQNQYIQTLEQYDVHQKIIENDFVELAFIAPTSYGKSSLILDLIKKLNIEKIKIGVIVPSKSLIVQTFNLLKKEGLNKRLLLHDEMFDNDESFIAIFTQERALRLLKNENVYFDILFIDEAHNILKKDTRSVLLSRLIKRNTQRLGRSKIIYLSPLISDSNNLKVTQTQSITEQKIHFNVKEPEIYEYIQDGTVRLYNRFLDEFYSIGVEQDFLTYIKNKSLMKNFLYLKRPKKVEELALELAEIMPSVENDMNSIVEVLSENIHESFYLVRLLGKGIIYLHGKLPDVVKEYMEYKFKSIPELKFIIANSVILEGVNLPIDNMFILNTNDLTEKDLTNLIGRINRLDTIFTKDQDDITKLLPQVHFVNTEAYGRKNGKMENAIKKLRSRIFKDKVQNPTLESYDLGAIDENNKEKIVEIIKNEEFLLSEPLDELNKLKQYFIENDLHIFYNDFNDVLNSVNKKIVYIREHMNEWRKVNLIDKIYWLFIKKLENFVTKYEFKRLEFEPTRKYYSMYIQRSHQNTLKENINHLFRYFKQRVKDNNAEFYFGNSYGEIPKSTSSYDGYNKNVYVDLSSKNDEELINLAIVKIQMEDNFISYTLNKFFEMLHDYELITDEEYNIHLYGTEVVKNIDLIKFGLNSSLINRLEQDEQLTNLEFDAYGNLMYNQEFSLFLNRIDDFYRFQILKYISKGFSDE